MSFNNLSVLDVSYDDKAYGNLIDPYEWNTNFKKIEEIFNQNKNIIESNFGLISASNTPSEAIEALGQTLPSNVKDQLLLIVSLLLTKADSSTVDSSISGLLKEAVLDQNTGIVTFTKFDGSTFSIDFATEKIPAKFELIEEDDNVYLQITNMDDTYTRTNVTALLNVYTFNNGNGIEFVVDGYDVSAHIKAGSLTTSHMSTELIQYFDNAVTQVAANALATESAKNEAISARDAAKVSADDAKNSENNAKLSKESSESNATLSKSYAVGGTGTRTNEDTDNAEYYMLQTKRLKEEAETETDNAANSAEAAKEARDTAKTSADEAKTSETNTKQSETNAKTSETNAKQSETNAKTSETNAKTSETNASSYANTAEQAKLAAEQARDDAREIVGGDYATETYVQQQMQAAKTNANTYTDEKVATAETNVSTYTDEKVATAETNANAYTDQKISEIPTPDVSGQIETHNTSSTAHEDIRTIANNALEGLNEKAPTEHTHDDRYYTETEVDTLLEDKANTPTVSITTLIARGWNSDKTYDLTTNYPSASYDIEISLTPTATATQVEAFTSAIIVGSPTSNILTSLGTVPTVSIPVYIKVVRK